MFETPERIFVVMEKLKGGTCVLDLLLFYSHLPLLLAAVCLKLKGGTCFVDLLLFSFFFHLPLLIPCNALSLFSCGKSGSRAAPERIENT